jgi:hypothetical protein
MSKIIVYNHLDGHVIVNYPTGEVPLEQVLERDIPSNTQYYILDKTELPTGSDDNFFESWELNNGKIVVNINKAIQMAQSRLNNLAYEESKHRSAKLSIGLQNVLNDNDWINLLNTSRANISSSTTTTSLLLAIQILQNTIQENAL